jgi:hypothetical protein
VTSGNPSRGASLGTISGPPERWRPARSWRWRSPVSCRPGRRRALQRPPAGGHVHDAPVTPADRGHRDHLIGPETVEVARDFTGSAGAGMPGGAVHVDAGAQHAPAPGDHVVQARVADHYPVGPARGGRALEVGFRAPESPRCAHRRRTVAPRCRPSHPPYPAAGRRRGRRSRLPPWNRPAPPRMRTTSMLGGARNRRRHSRLNYDGLSWHQCPGLAGCSHHHKP